MENKNKTGHLCALLTIMIWGTTFISTKILLVDFRPIENFSRSIFYGHFEPSVSERRRTITGKVLCWICSCNGRKLSDQL